MRKPERLNDFYTALMEVHKRSFPDWRFGQLIQNFLGWYVYKYKRDVFFLEEDAIIQRIYEYANETSPLYRGWEVADELQK